MAIKDLPLAALENALEARGYMKRPAVPGMPDFVPGRPTPPNPVRSPQDFKNGNVLARLTDLANRPAINDLTDEELAEVVMEKQGYAQLRANFPTDADKDAWLAENASFNIIEGETWFPCVDITTL